MKDELVDIISETGKFLYKTAKAEAHKKGLLHRCVVAEIINSKSEWLLVIPHDYKQDFGQYVSPIGGHVSAGESEESALKREALEEVGIQASAFKLAGRGIFNRKILGRHENHFFVLFEIYTDQKPELSDEVKSFKYFTKKEIQEKIKLNPQMFGDAFHFVYKNIYEEFRLVE